MKEVKHYICEICGTEYNEKKKCENCEKGHNKPKKIVKAKYRAISQNALGIPTHIDVEMENGKVYTYKYGS